MKPSPILALCALALVGPAVAAIQTRAQLVGRWNLHTNGPPSYKLYIDLRSNGTFERYNELRSNRETGSWEQRGQKVVLNRTQLNGTKLAGRTTLTYHASGVLRYDDHWIESYCKEDHPHRGPAVRKQPSNVPKLAEMRKKAYHYYDPKTGLSFSIHPDWSNKKDEVWIVESANEFEARAIAAAKKILIPQGVNPKKIVWCNFT